MLVCESVKDVLEESSNLFAFGFVTHEQKTFFVIFTPLDL